MQSSSLYKINLHDPFLFHQWSALYDIVRSEFQDIVLGRLWIYFETYFYVSIHADQKELELE